MGGSLVVVVARLLHDDPYNSLCLPLYVAVLVELKKLNGTRQCILCGQFLSQELLYSIFMHSVD